MDEVVDGLEIGRPRRAAEAGMRRRDDLGVLAEQVEKRRPRVDGLQAVQQQDGSTSAAAQHFQLDSPHDEPR